MEGHLKGLRTDSEKLGSLVAKYGKIHDEGAGRRLLFTLKESGGLTDLRRRIGLHEQMLQIWYMTLVYGSLRRLESGQEDIQKAIEAMNNWSLRKMGKVRQSLNEGDVKPLERELRKSGLEPQAVHAALGTAVDYVDAEPLERVRMESRAKSRATVYPEASSRPVYQGFPFDESLNYKRSPYPPPPPKPHKHRRQRSSTQQPPTDKDDLDNVTDDSSYDEPYESRGKVLPKNKRNTSDRHKAEKPSKNEREQPSKGHDAAKLTADFGRPRSSSQTPKPIPPSITLVVPDTIPHRRPASYHDPSDRYDRLSPDAGGRSQQEYFITVNRTPQRHRSVSRERHPVDRDRRDHSTHSYTRRRSSSRGDNGGENAER